MLWSLRKEISKSIQSKVLESLDEKSNIPHLQIRLCKIPWLLENPQGYHIFKNIFQCNCYLPRRVSRSDSQILKIGHSPGTTSWKRATCWRGKKITLQLFNTRQLLESSSPKLFFFLPTLWEQNECCKQSEY